MFGTPKDGRFSKQRLNKDEIDNVEKVLAPQKQTVRSDGKIRYKLDKKVEVNKYTNGTNNQTNISN